MSYLDTLIEAQARNTHATREILDKMEAEGRTAPTVEERTALDSLDAEYAEREGIISERQKQEAREASVAAARANAPEAREASEMRTAAPENVAEILKDLATGRRSSYTFEARAVSTTTTAGGYTIPQGFGGRIIEKMLTVGPMLDESVVNLIRTDSNQDIPFPIENARATGTATAEATAYGDSAPTFTQKTLKAYKYGTIVLASDELLNSEDVGLQDYLARNLGVAVGTAVNSILTLGTGTVQPEGVAGAAGSGVTGGTGVSGVPTYENLVDLIHGVDSLYANQPSSGFMMRRTTLGSVRKIKDTAGAYIFVERANASMPGTILGYNVFENPYVAATATSAKSILFGDFSYFLVRQVGGVELSRTTDRYWDTDQVGLKVRTWVDSFLGQSEAVKYFAGGTA